MHRSLDILQNIPGHEERRETYSTLSNNLLSQLRPKVRRDIVGFDFSSLREYLYVYEKLGRFALFTIIQFNKSVPIGGMS